MKKNNIILITSTLLFCLMIFTGANCSNNQPTSTDSGTVKNASTSQAETIKSNDDVNNELVKLAITVGPSDSKVTIIEASDIECPACRSVHPEIAKTVEAYKDKVQFGYLPYPLSYHADALPAAYAIEAANLQGKGWEMHDALFEASEYDENGIVAAAQNIGLDMDKFNSDRVSDEIKKKIDDSKTLLDELGLAGTPTFYINGTEYQSNPSFSNLSAQIDKLLSN